MQSESSSSIDAYVRAWCARPPSGVGGVRAMILSLSQRAWIRDHGVPSGLARFLGAQLFATEVLQRKHALSALRGVLHPLERQPEFDRAVVSDIMPAMRVASSSAPAGSAVAASMLFIGACNALFWEKSRCRFTMDATELEIFFREMVHPEAMIIFFVFSGSADGLSALCGNANGITTNDDDDDADDDDDDDRRWLEDLIAVERTAPHVMDALLRRRPAAAAAESLDDSSGARRGFVPDDVLPRDSTLVQAAGLAFLLGNYAVFSFFWSRAAVDAVTTTTTTLRAAIASLLAHPRLPKGFPPVTSVGAGDGGRKAKARRFLRNVSRILSVVCGCVVHDPHVISRRADEPPAVCPISLTEIQKTDACLRTPCGHVFKEEELFQWLLRCRTCPVCRAFML